MSLLMNMRETVADVGTTIFSAANSVREKGGQCQLAMSLLMYMREVVVDVNMRISSEAISVCAKGEKLEQACTHDVTSFSAAISADAKGVQSEQA